MLTGVVAQRERVKEITRAIHLWQTGVWEWSMVQFASNLSEAQWRNFSALRRDTPAAEVIDMVEITFGLLPAKGVC